MLVVLIQHFLSGNFAFSMTNLFLFECTAGLIIRTLHEGARKFCAVLTATLNKNYYLLLVYQYQQPTIHLSIVVAHES